MTVSLRGTREVAATHQVFRLNGMLDAFSEQNIRKVLQQAVETGPKQVILDLSKIEFIDSSGLGILVQTAKQLQASQGHLQVVTNPRVTQAVKLVRLDQFLSLQPSLDVALAAVSGTN
ncbi:STAS domain-containing protein [Gloeomargarita lithophora]|uniref:STAS domain-containing protein n=1 Tax=Gloeomargarita lithophora TaxID=1188228 RepID=UPI0009FDA936